MPKTVHIGYGTTKTDGYGAVKTVSVSVTILVLTPTPDPKRPTMPQFHHQQYIRSADRELNYIRQNSIDDYINY